MHSPIIADGRTVDPLLDAPTALHCEACGETLALGECHNVNCETAGVETSRAIAGPMFAPRAWTLGGRVD